MELYHGGWKARVSCKSLPDNPVGKNKEGFIMAISSKSKLREIIADERAVAIINEYIPGFVDNPELGPCMGMRLNLLLKFPQVGLPKEAIDDIISRIDALDA